MGQIISRLRCILFIIIVFHGVTSALETAPCTTASEIVYAFSGFREDMKEKDYAQGEVFVKFKGFVSDQRVKEIINEQEAVILNYISEIKVYHLRLKDGQSVEYAVKDFKAYLEVDYAEPNYIRKLR